MSYDDMIPEENEEQYKQLIPLLRRGFRKSVALSSSESTQIIDQVRERLQQANYQPSQREKTLGQMTSMPTTSAHGRRRSVRHFLNILAAVLVVSILISTSLILFRSRSNPLTSAATPVTASTGPTARSQANGLEATMHIVTPGPYFLSELLLVDVSLTNHTKALVTLNGTNRADSLCPNAALTAQMTGKGAPTYVFPPLNFACAQPARWTQLASGQTLTIRQYLPMARSGEVTLTVGPATGYPPSGPLTGHWPSLQVRVDSRVPSDRTISLHAQGSQVMIQAPKAARPHLLYMESISCNNYHDQSGTNDWTPLTTTVLSRPACSTAYTYNRWDYVVSAPGFPIVSGKQLP
jgi:hypothetical protein